MITIGVDPGASGGVAYHSEAEGIFEAHNLYPMSNLLNNLIMFRQEDWKMQVVVEDVPPYTGSNIPQSASFKLGKSCGMVEGLALGERLPCYKVTPRDWQKSLPGIKGKTGNDRKKILKDICLRLYPNLIPTLKTCDAILILHQFITNKTNPK